MSAFEAIIEALLRSSLQGALFIAAVWLVCRLFPRLPAAVRCGLWWAACLKLLVGLVWISPVELPLLPAAADSAGVSHRIVAGAVKALTSPALLSRPLPSPLTGRGGRTATDSGSLFPSPGEGGREGAGEGPGVRAWEGEPKGMRGGWGSEALALLWLAGLAALSAKALRQLRVTRRVIRLSEPVREGWIRTAFAELCARLALRRSPELRGSAEVRTPQAIGLRRPLVLLPKSGLALLSRAEVSMTLCHELVHLRRGDLWLGWVPALAHRIFFFHPLAALAAREYAIAREAACDAEVLRLLGTAPQAYGRLLLRWGVAPRETGLAAAGASPSLQNLKRRLQMLQQTSTNKRRLSGWWWLAGAVVLAGLIPLRIVAQQPAPEAQAETAAEVAEAPEAPDPVLAPAPEDAPLPPSLADGIPGGIEGGVPGGVEGGIPGGVEGGVAGGVEGAIAGGVEGGVAGGVHPVVAPIPSRPALAPVAGTPPATLPALPALPPARRGPAGALPAPRALPGTPPVAPAPAALARPGQGPVAMAALAPTPATPRAQVAPPPPVPPVPPVPPKNHGVSYRYSDDGDSWVLLYGNGSSTMSGSIDSIQKVKRLRGSSKEDILWYRHDGKEYVVRDAAVLERAKEIFRPQMELGAKQGELGGRQGALGAKQGALGAKQGALGAEIAALAVKGIGGDGEDDPDLEKRQEEIDRQQKELGRQQAELGRQQAALGKQQAELGRQQAAATEKAEKELRALMEQAIRSGAAQPIKE
jgi:bla regulator protein blaR1